MLPFLLVCCRCVCFARVLQLFLVFVSFRVSFLLFCGRSSLESVLFQVSVAECCLSFSVVFACGRFSPPGRVFLRSGVRRAGTGTRMQNRATRALVSPGALVSPSTSSLAVRQYVAQRTLCHVPDILPYGQRADVRIPRWSSRLSRQVKTRGT